MGDAGVETVYRERLAERQRDLARWSRRELWVSWSRLVAVLAGVVLAWLAVQNRLFSLAWAVAPFLGFFVLVVVHERVLRRRGRCERAADFYRRGLDRLAGQWVGRGDDGERFRDPAHLYAEDLDLFGRGSLFELISAARTEGGARALAGWLKEPAAFEEARARQAAVAELRDRLDLREDLSALGIRLRSELEPEALAAWAQEPSKLARFAVLRPLLPVFAIANVAASLGWWLWGWGAAPLLALALGGTLLWLGMRRSLTSAISGVDRAAADLALLSEVLERIEAERFLAPWLVERGAALGDGGETGDGRDSAARSIRHLRRWVDLLDSRRNPLFAPFALLLWWTPQVAFAIDRWRSRHGAQVVRWLEVVAELEAIASLAGFAFERPASPFPELIAVGDGEDPRVEGRGLAHPLIPEDRCVRNDLDLGPGRQVWVVSGSNMSGKSTFLRTCGVNVVLALAGAPVCARSLRLSPLQLGATIRVQDSLQEGASRFYAEILRLRRLLDATGGSRPLFFLLDEILHGTNSHDRRIGARAVVHAFVERGALGLVTTHDLALSEMASEDSSQMANVHFDDSIEDGRVRFDYVLKPGVVTRSNALALMREVGLEV